ncbi:MAG: zinc-ribbon domain containing protein [Chloroflexi bacterium]|nr:zinc-ribbon domain containing protein [Chloroflexota bacterium]
MSFQDKTIKCADCGSDFTFSAEEQEFFKTKGFTNEPKRCPACRQAKKSEQRGGGYSSRSEMYPATCAQCGKETQVPFEPRGDKPVYCSECYSSIRKPR